MEEDVASCRRSVPGRTGEAADPEPGGANGEFFEDNMKRFTKESQERLLDLKRSTEAKRGRGRRG